VAVEQYTFTHKQYTEYRERNIHNNQKIKHTYNQKINKSQTADSISSMDNMVMSQVTTVEKNRHDMNNFSQETPLRKPLTEQCGKRNINQMNLS
jgi:hypothetical protein